jgi:Protein of unknown function (DUF3047)
MKSLAGLLVGCLAAAALAGCAGEERRNPLLADGSPSIVVMEFRQPLALDPPPEGWRHRRFFRTDPMQIGFATKAGRPAIRLATQASGSMLYRHTELPLEGYPILRWDWFIDTPIATAADEMTVAGDDHPARLFLTFRSPDGERRSMEIVWGNRRLRAGDWKDLQLSWFGKPFPHYVARGGDENAGRWHDESADLRSLYRRNWGDPRGALLVEVALFCDTDQTGAKSVAYFSTVRVERAAAAR